MSSKVVVVWWSVVLLAVTVNSRPGEKRPFPSVKAPAETIRNYEVYMPSISNEERSQGELRSFDLEIANYSIHLELNSGLIPAHFTSHHLDGDGRILVEKGHVNCFYQGSVRDHPEWHVSMSTCRGFQGSFGKLGTVDSYYHLEPQDANSTQLLQPHVFYAASEYSQQERACGTLESRHSLGDHLADALHINAKNRVRRQANSFRIVEWAVINDFMQYDTFQRNLSATVLRSLEIANHVDSLFRVLNVRIVVVHVMTWSTSDQIAYPSRTNVDPSVLLNNLEEYVPQITATHDSVMLLTGVDLMDNTVGKAFVGTMCRGSASVGLTQDGGRSVDSVGSTAAHELGHIFSMDHDEGGCSCNDPSGDCIMSAVSGFPSPTAWSSCSRQQLQEGLVDEGLGTCLNNEPLVTVADPVCGNGIRERDEICDCGTLQECTDPCCNATSCMLNAGAQCARGQCCSDSCQFRPLGTSCRPASQQCDIAEFCTGDSSSCPTDVHLQDATPCNDNQSFCYAGICPSHDAQCQRFFGSSSSIPQCYSEQNVLGEGAGNCGSSGGSFRACPAEHVQCGQLQCLEGEFTRGSLGGSFTIFTRSARDGNGGFETCMSFSSRPNSDTVSPGLVADGTKCGESSLCLIQRCTAISDLDNIRRCPVGNNGLVCSGTGVCNNLNQCSCEAGNRDPTCDPSGRSGGSNAGAIAGAVVGVLLALAVGVGVTVGVVILVLKLRSRPSNKYLPPAPKQDTNKPKPQYKPPPSRPSTTPSNRLAPPSNRSTPPTPRSGPSTPRGQPPPPKPAPPPSPANKLARPPQSKPAPPTNTRMTPHATPSAPPKPGKIQRQWPPPAGEETAANVEVKPAAPKKPVLFPPRR